MAAFNGKWQLTGAEGLVEYHNTIHTPDAYKEQLRRLAEGVKTNPGGYVEELHVDKAAGKVQRIVYILGEKKKDTGLLDLGKEGETTAMDGRHVKGTITLESDTKIVMHETGPDFTATVTFTVSGDELTVTSQSGSATAAMKYKKV
jgi:hypothetical protein